MQEALRHDGTSVDKQKRFIITGLGGQGKSEVCLKFASLMREEYVSNLSLILSGLLSEQP